MYEKIHRTMTVAQIIKSEKFTDEKKVTRGSREYSHLRTRYTYRYLKVVEGKITGEKER